ncbi:periplasmic protein TonB [Sphingomonas sp. F9_3S_D5_B_2]
MYRSSLDTKDKSGAILAVVAIHAALLLMLLNLAGKIDVVNPQTVLRVFDLKQAEPPPPPPPPPPPARQQPTPRRKQAEGGSAPANVKSQATPVVALIPRVETPPIQQIAVTETPREGTEATQGATTVQGPGTGAGGAGNGNGSGAGGSGPGGGGDGGIAERAHLLTGPLRTRDFPPEMRRQLSRGAAPFIMFTVLPDGRVTNCRIYQSSGDLGLDNATCALVTSKFVYRPAFNRRGEPVPSQMAYRQAR